MTAVSDNPGVTDSAAPPPATFADEHAFNVIPEGISIHVGARRHSNAQFCLRNPDEVRLFLERLEKELPA